MGFAWEQKFGGQYTGERASWCGGHRSLQLLGRRTSDVARVLMDSGREFAPCVAGLVLWRDLWQGLKHQQSSNAVEDWQGSRIAI